MKEIWEIHHPFFGVWNGKGFVKDHREAVHFNAESEAEETLNETLGATSSDAHFSQSEVGPFITAGLVNDEFIPRQVQDVPED